MSRNGTLARSNCQKEMMHPDKMMELRFYKLVRFTFDSASVLLDYMLWYFVSCYHVIMLVKYNIDCMCNNTDRFVAFDNCLLVADTDSAGCVAFVPHE